MAKNETSGCAWMALVLVLVVGVWVVKSCREMPPSNPVAMRENQLISAAQAAVRANLKDSKTADFKYMDTRLLDMGGGVWTVSGTVRASNSFGAFVKTPWKVKLKEDGAKWQAVSVVFE